MAKQFTPQQDMSTHIYPLPAARLYLEKVGDMTGRMDVSVINGVKLSFTAHLYNGDNYSNATCGYYSLVMMMQFAELRKLIDRDTQVNGPFAPYNHSLSTSTNYDNQRKDMSMQFLRDDKGIWNISLNVTGKPQILIPFTGIKTTIMSKQGGGYSGAELSAKHFVSWMNLVESCAQVGMMMFGYDGKKILPARGSSEEIVS